MEEDTPAPRPAESNPLMAPEYMPLVENFLQSGLGAIPGTKRRVLIEDLLISGRGVIPG